MQAQNTENVIKKINTLDENRLKAYDEFVYWFVLPVLERRNRGLDTYKDFSEKYGIPERTLYRWQGTPGFKERVDDLRYKIAHNKTQGVIDGMYTAALRGNDKSQKLWLQVFEGFTEKSEVEHTHKVELKIDDIRYLINGLPEPKRSEHYANLVRLLEDADMAAKAGAIEIGNSTIGYEDDLQGQTDNDAQNASDARTDAVAKSYPPSVCADMVRKASESDHKSASGWW
jgi:hypothetical protein